VGRRPRGGDAYVDYAHTPDGLETVLQALRPHVHGKLIVVFGAGGDRTAASVR
jgi:UDP-N-acetylmuramoyl-L-alanyl-D-glutamate--2,6-diaminopimelate ligase